MQCLTFVLLVVPDLAETPVTVIHRESDGGEICRCEEVDGDRLRLADDVAWHLPVVRIDHVRKAEREVKQHVRDTQHAVPSLAVACSSHAARDAKVEHEGEEEAAKQDEYIQNTYRYTEVLEAAGA